MAVRFVAPLRLIEKAILLMSHPGDMVVDPFAGVCTVAAACQRTGRRSISIDLDTTYLAAGAARLKG